jgi:hypothetical protein
MRQLIISRVSTGRVQRRAFPSLSAAEKHRSRREEFQRRAKAGLRGIGVEIAHHTHWPKSGTVSDLKDARG